MSQNPGYYNPNAPYMMPYAVTNPRPTSVTVLAIIGIIIGSLGVLCLGLGSIFQLYMFASGGRNPFAPGQPVPADEVLNGWNLAAGLIGLALSAVLLLASIFSLRLSPGAWRWIMIWSITQIVWQTITLVIALVWVNPRAAEIMKQSQSQVNPQAAGAISSFIGPAQAIATVVVWLLACILPVLFLTLWRRPNVKAAFGQAPAPVLPQQPPPYPAP